MSMTTSESIDQVATALIKAQADFPIIPKNQTAKIRTKSGYEYSYRYSDLNDTIQAVKNALANAKLAITQGLGMSEGKASITTLLIHESGQYFKTVMEVTIDEDMKGNAMQRLGSSITYGRRYALSAILGIASEEDDDGHRGDERKTEKQSTGSGSRPATKEKDQKAQDPGNGGNGGNGDDILVTPIEVPGEYWGMYRKRATLTADQKKAIHAIIGGDGYGVKKNDQLNKWFITKKRGMPDPVLNSSKETKSPAPVSSTRAPDESRLSPDLGDEISPVPGYADLMVKIYQVKTPEMAQEIYGLIYDCAKAKSVSPTEFEKAKKTLLTICRAKNLEVKQ